MNLKVLIKKEPLILPGVYDGISALLAEKSGYKALYLSGAALSVSLLGKPDIGLLTLDEVAAVTKRIHGATPLPLLVDADTGFGGEINVVRTVQELEAAGAAGVQIEDQVFPKRCGHLTGKAVIPVNQMVKKIQLAKKARKNTNFVIVARTDARAVEGVSKAIRRAEAYKKAGADIIFPEALQSVAEFRAFSRKKRLGTLMANMTEFGISPVLTVDQLVQLGYRVVLFPMTAFRLAAHSMEKGYKQLRREGQNQVTPCEDADAEGVVLPYWLRSIQRERKNLERIRI